MNETFNALATFAALAVGVFAALLLLIMFLAGLYLRDRWQLEVQLDEMKKSATLVSKVEDEQ